jgi:hypothetical protein
MRGSQGQVFANKTPPTGKLCSDGHEEHKKTQKSRLLGQGKLNRQGHKERQARQEIRVYSLAHLASLAVSFLRFS